MLKSLLMASALTMAFSGAAMAQSVQPFDPSLSLNGPFNGATAAAPWSTIRRSGVNCNTGAPVTLTNSYFQGTTTSNLGGKHGAISPDQPIVAKNFGSSPYSSGTVTPPGGLLMHPGPAYLGSGGECAIARLTIPAGQGGVYAVSAQYRGAYPNNGVSNGDGVNGMVLKNSVQIGGTVNTANGVGNIQQQITLCPGDTLDYAVHMKQNHLYDSTLVAGKVTKMANAPADVCGGIIVVPPDTVVGASPCCAPWSELNIGPSLVPTFTNASSPYTMQYQADATIGAQMAAYLNYIHAMDPSITTISLTWQAVDVGTTPGMSGTAAGGPQTLTWTWTSGGVIQPTGSFWGSQLFQVGRWYRYWTKLSHNGTPNSPYFGKDCINNSKAFMWGMAAMIAGGNGGNGGSATLSTTNARGQIVKAQPIAFQSGKPLVRIEIPRD